MPRGRALAIAAAAVAVAAAVVVLVLVGRGGEGPPGATAGTTAGPTGPATTPGLPAGVPPMPGWGPVVGAPPDFTVPPGGDATATPVPGGMLIEITRDDGTRLAVAVVDGGGVCRQAHYFDREGRLALAVDRVDVAPAGTGGSGGGGCGDARTRAGFRWTALPVAWRLNTRSVPRRLGVARVRAEARAARGVWAGNVNRCGVPDRSRAAFRLRGATTRGIGRNGISTIGFGESDDLGGTCVGAVACTFTWTAGTRALESDVRVDRDRAYATAPRPGRWIDLRSVLVHESGHTLGLDHVRDRGNVMFPTVRAGDTSHRRLGRGDARANNVLY